MPKSRYARKFLQVYTSLACSYQGKQLLLLICDRYFRGTYTIVCTSIIRDTHISTLAVLIQALLLCAWTAFAESSPEVSIWKSSVIIHRLFFSSIFKSHLLSRTSKNASLLIRSSVTHCHLTPSLVSLCHLS